MPKKKTRPPVNDDVDEMRDAVAEWASAFADGNRHTIYRKVHKATAALGLDVLKACYDAIDANADYNFTLGRINNP